jgi:hypothetical protein
MVSLVGRQPPFGDQRPALLPPGYLIFSWAPRGRGFNLGVASRHQKDGRVEWPLSNLDCLT